MKRSKQDQKAKQCRMGITTGAVAAIMVLSVMAAGVQAQDGGGSSEALLALQAEANVAAEGAATATFAGEQVRIETERPFDLVLVELCGGESARVALDAAVTAHTLVAEEPVVAVTLLADAEIRLENPAAECPPPEGDEGGQGEGGSGGSEGASSGGGSSAHAGVDVVFHADLKGLDVTADSEIKALTLELCWTDDVRIELDAATKAHTQKAGKVILAVVVEARSSVRFVNEEAECPEPKVDVVFEGGTLVKIDAEVELKKVLLVLCDGTELLLEVEAAAKALVHQAEKPIAAVKVDIGAELMLFKQTGVLCPPADGGAECDGPQEINAWTEGATNVVSWSEVEDAQGYRLYRAESGGEFGQIATLPGMDNTTYRDADVEPGTTYEYAATAIVEGEETDACDKVEITAVPVLPGLFAGLAATLAGLGAYTIARRRD